MLSKPYAREDPLQRTPRNSSDTLPKLDGTTTPYEDQYYRGLKDAVKDELIKEERPEALDEMISTAVKIDNRHYERALERKGFYDSGRRQNHRMARPRAISGLNLWNWMPRNRKELTPQRQTEAHDERRASTAENRATWPELQGWQRTRQELQ